jgi:hypothetical protein
MLQIVRLIISLSDYSIPSRLEQFTSLLTSLLSDGALGQLAGVIASVAGVNRGNSSSLIGMLAPIIIGVLKKKVFDGGLNAGSLSSMLTEQKDNVSAALPQGFSSQLQSAGFFDSIAPDALSVLGKPQTQASPAPAVGTQPATPTPGQNNSGGGLMKWILPLIVLAGIAWVGMLQPLLDKISAIPGVGAVIEPFVAPIMEMLNGMTGE